jgi:hypothetical protein
MQLTENEENVEKEKLDKLLSDKRFGQGRAAVIVGVIGFAVTLAVLLLLRFNSIEFVWGEKARFWSFIPACLFLIPVIVGSLVCRKQCVLHIRPKREQRFYAVAAAVSAVVAAAALIRDSALLDQRFSIRSDVEIREGEPIVVIETDYKTLSNTNRWINLYRDYGFFTKLLAVVKGNWVELTYADDMQEYTLNYYYIFDSDDKKYFTYFFRY